MTQNIKTICRLSDRLVTLVVSMILMFTALPASATSLHNELREMLVAGGGHSVGVVVARNGTITDTFTLSRDLTLSPDSPSSLNGRSIFRVASVSKIVIGLSALKFFADRGIALTTPIEQLAPGLAFDNPWQDVEPVRVIHLLEHTTGLHEIIARWPQGDLDQMSLAEVLQQCFNAALIRLRPGTTNTYSNYNYVALNAVIENLAGVPFDQVIADNIFDPLGMTDSTFRLSNVDTSRLAPAYYPGSEDRVELEDGPYRAAAGMYSSPRDLGIFLEMLLNLGTHKGKQVVSAALVEALQVPVSALAAKDGMILGHGPGAVRRQTGGRIYAGHNGMMEGYSARLYYSLSRGEGYALILNTHPFPEGPSLSGLGKIIEKHVFSAPKPQPEAEVMPDMKRWEGFYRFENPRFFELSPFAVPAGSGWIEQRGDRLYFDPLVGDEVDYVAAGNNQFRRPYEHSPSLVFGNTAEDERYLFRLKNMFYRPAHPVPAFVGLVSLGFGLGMVVIGLVTPLVLLLTAKRGSRNLRMAWVLIAVCSWTLAASLALAIGFRSTQLATSMNALSLAVATTTLFVPILAAVSLVFALRAWRSRARSLTSVWPVLVSGGLVLLCVVLAPYGWLPLILW